MGPIGAKKHMAPFLPSHSVVSAFLLPIMDDIMYNMHTCFQLYPLKSALL